MDSYTKRQIFLKLAEDLNFSSILELFPSVTPDDLKKLMEEAGELIYSSHSMLAKDGDPLPAGLNPTEIIINIDGASRGNPGKAGAGVVIKSASGEILEKISIYLGETTNNVAEYQALILAFKHAEVYQPEKVEILSDSLLLVKQMCGDYKVKDFKLKELFTQANSLFKKFKVCSFRHIPREKNREADQLASWAASEGGKADRMVAGLEKRREESPSSTEQGAG